MLRRFLATIGIFLAFSITLQALNNETCAKATEVTIPYNTDNSVSSGGSDNRRDYFTFTPLENGTANINITITSTDKDRSLDVRLYHTQCTNNNTYRLVDLSGTGNFSFSRDLIADTKYILFIQHSTLSGEKNYNLDIAFQPAPSAFSLRQTMNLRGNMKVVGNTVLCLNNAQGNCIETPDINTNANHNINLRYSRLPADNGNNAIFNSSSATLQDNAIIPTATNPNPARIVWAGLYWSGYLHTYVPNHGNQTQFLGLAQNNQNIIMNAINNHTIRFRVGNDSFNIINNGGNRTLGTNVQYDGTDQGYWGISYGCFANVTQILQDRDPRATYSVANVPAMEGRTAAGWDFGGAWDGLGNSGAWSLVVIYENNSVGERMRNTTVFDGFVSVGDNNNQNIVVDGFLTPRSGTVDSTLSVFANEGDKYIFGDQFFFRNLDGDNNGQQVELRNSQNNLGNFFDSSISGVPTRTPNLINNNGIDIHTKELGAGGYNIIGNNQTRARISFTSEGDVYYPVMAGFATQLYVPDVCYDYAAYIGDHIPVPLDGDRSFSVSKWGDDDPLNIKVFIRSNEGDFDLVRTGLIVDTATPSKLGFDISQTKVSPPFLNIYNQAIEINATTHEFSIGKNNTTLGGTIGSNESIYAKAAFDFKTSDLINSSFDVTLKASIAFDPTNPNVLTPYTFSTKDGSLNRCQTKVVYDPVWHRFNVERDDSTFTQLAGARYPLYTQVAGRPFAVSIASYLNQPSFNTKEAVSQTTTLDLELIDASGFENDANTGYDSICSDPSAVGEGRFVKLNSGQDRVNVAGISSEVALRSAAFRIWVLTKPGEDTMVAHNCSSPNDDTCFKGVYDTHYKNTDTLCQSACGSSPSGCYQCLKMHYAQPMCSRDNFAIRPDGFNLKLSDANQDTEPTATSVLVGDNTASDTRRNVVAGYDYVLNLNALQYNSASIALGYYNDNFQANTLDTLPTSGSIAALEFKDSATCNSTEHHTYRLRPINGVYTTPLFSFGNVGRYDFWVKDTEWTQVDQATYPHKPKFGTATATNDCLVGSASSADTGKVGCDIRSSLDKANYNTIQLSFSPYTFSVNAISMSTSPNINNTQWLYVNNLNEDDRMGVLFNGNLTALNAKGVATSNFTGSCAATDVSMDFNISTDSSLTAINLNNGSTMPVRLNNRLELNSDNNPDFTVIDGNVTSMPTIGANKFLNDRNGSVEIDSRYNYTKDYQHASNPIVANFQTLIASSPDATATAHMNPNYTPTGTRDYNSTRTFYYSRVYPSTEGTIPETYNETYGGTTLTLLVYSSDTNTTYPGLNTSALNSPILRWYKMTNHESPIEGQIISLVPDAPSTTINPNSNINFFQGGIDAIAISHPLEDRDRLVTITVTPDAWLKYNINNPNGLPQFSVNFLSLDFEWTGVGETGNVIDDKPSTGSKDRTSW